jgi:hypothetical protein
MKFLVYLMTLLFSTAVAQNPTILQGSYISNVFGNSNFVLNPNAQTNVANVTTVTATVARSTTTPLVATSEFTVAIGTANGTATWATRAFDAGMKGQNCEARFSYRGFAATSIVQIKQSTNVVASLTLTPATDPRIASINFPCGDLSAATTFVVTDTAILAGTNEIGGIYVGLATNMANVAQAETVVIANVNAQITIPTVTYTNVPYQSESLDAYGEYNNSTGVFTAKRAGNYFIAASMFWLNSTWGASNIYLNVYKNGSLIVENLRQIPAGTTYHVQESSVSISLSVGDTLYVSAYQNDTANRFIAGNSSFSRLSISRFPSASELVVTPERQNTFGGVKYVNSNQAIRNTSAPSATYFEFNNATWNQPTLLIGKAAVTTTGSGNDLGFSMPNLPVGQYKVSIRGLINASTGNATTIGHAVNCSFKVRETIAGTDVALQVHRDVVLSTTPTSSRDYEMSFFGVFNNTSVATRNFRLEAAKVADNTTGSIGTCQAYSNTASEITEIVFLLEPLDQPSNSALYVQGPVKAAETGTASAAGYQGEEVSGTSTAGTGNECAKVTVNPGQWILYGMAYANMTAIGPTPSTYYYDVEIDDFSGALSAGTGSFQRTYFNSTSDAVLLSTTRIVRTSVQKIYYLNCRSGTGTKTNNISVFKAVRLN